MVTFVGLFMGISLADVNACFSRLFVRRKGLLGMGCGLQALTNDEFLRLTRVKTRFVNVCKDILPHYAGLCQAFL